MELALMKNSPVIHRVFALALPVIVGLLGGCTQQIEITQYPDFYNPDDPSTNIQSLAVLPFRNQAPDADKAKAGDAVAENLAGLLSQTKTYRDVYNRNNLSALFDEQDLQVLMGGDPAASADRFKKHTQVDAIVTGAVTTWASSTSRRTQQMPQYAFNPKTKQMYISHYLPVTITRNEGNVSVTATVTRVSDGAPIHSSPPMQGHFVSEGQSPTLDQFGCLRQASNIAVRGLLEQFAIVRKTITVPHSAFQTATDLYDGEWNYESTFKTTDKRMFVVLKLPDSCDRNRFRITIVREDQRNDLALQNIVWAEGKSQLGEGYEFDPSEIARKGGGPGTYVAKFYPGPEPKLFAKFKIESP
jgi:TolB-like protein